MKKAFTLIELLVVIGMLALLIGAAGASVNQARRRAKIVKATQDVKEITNAILGFQNYAQNRSLQNYATGSWKDATEGALSIIFGGVTSESGAEVPVLYNGHLTNGRLVDPWGTTYRISVRSGTIQAARFSETKTGVMIPNLWALDVSERVIYSPANGGGK